MPLDYLAPSRKRERQPRAEPTGNIRSHETRPHPTLCFGCEAAPLPPRPGRPPWEGSQLGCSDRGRIRESRCTASAKLSAATRRSACRRTRSSSSVTNARRSAPASRQLWCPGSPRLVKNSSPRTSASPSSPVRFSNTLSSTSRSRDRRSAAASSTTARSTNSSSSSSRSETHTGTGTSTFPRSPDTSSRMGRP